MNTPQNYKIMFNDLPWFEAGDGMRYKRIQQGDTQVRLVEWDKAMVHANWCVKGHIGYVTEGCPSRLHVFEDVVYLTFVRPLDQTVAAS
jgi:hypothetical protein